MSRIIVITVAVLAAVSLGGATMAEAEQLNMGGSSTSSGYFPYYTAVAKSITEASDDINVTLVSPGGFVKNLELIKKGELDFGGTSPALIASANAEGFDKMRVLWWVNPAIQNIMVRKDSGIKTLSDLNGKCFHLGKNGSSTQKNMLQILEILDIRPDLYLSDPKDAINAIKNGRCEGQVKSVTGNQLDGATAELNLATPLWPIGYTDEEKAKVKEAMPWMSFFELDPGMVEGAPGYSTHTIWVGFAGTTDLDEETGYKLVKGMMAGMEDQRAALKALAGLDVPSQTIRVSSSYLHAGAVKFYREMGLDIPETLIPPEAR